MIQCAAYLPWAIAAAAIAGIIVRPFGWPEYVWALAGAALLVLSGLLPPADAVRAVGKGDDVYLFLIGMMLLAETARREGLFDWLAAQAVRRAKGSAPRLFAMVYVVGTLVTILLSNDATAIVLTPAVYAAARAAGTRPLPYLFACAFIANAASFVLPISNPANLVVFGDEMPPLLDWLKLFALPSLAAIAATYAVLRFTQRAALRAPLGSADDVKPLSRGGLLAALGIVAAAIVMLTASALGRDLGLPTFVAGIVVAAVVLILRKASPWPVLQAVSWSVLPLVAGLFVLVEALGRTPALPALAKLLHAAAATSPQLAGWAAGIAVALASNIVNNLPMGLMAASIDQAAQSPPAVTAAVLIGVDLGPNLSVTGSLATILWLIVIRREGEDVAALRFLRLGALVMPPALLLSLAALLLR